MLLHGRHRASTDTIFHSRRRFRESGSGTRETPSRSRIFQAARPPSRDLSIFRPISGPVAHALSGAARAEMPETPQPPGKCGEHRLWTALGVKGSWLIVTPAAPLHWPAAGRARTRPAPQVAASASEHGWPAHINPVSAVDANFISRYKKRDTHFVFPYRSSRSCWQQQGPNLTHHHPPAGRS